MQIKYSQRAEKTNNPTAKKLFQLIENKKTNLSLSLDITQKNKFLELVDTVGPEICLLKTHIDIIEDFSSDLIDQLTKLAKKHHFLIFEDRKFADIGNTVKLQYEKGIYHIADWADITNAHIISGEGVIEGLKEIGLPRQRGLLLVAQLSTKENLIDEHYTQTAIKMAKQHADFVIGFISQQKLIDDPQFIHATPGVNMAEKGDVIGQQYRTPQQAIVEDGNDIIIVGRGIYDAKDALNAAKKYREAGWEAYEEGLRIAD